MSLFQIFKVNKLTKKDKTDTIYVFFGANMDLEADPNELFERDPTNEVFANVFKPDELDNIKTNNIR